MRTSATDCLFTEGALTLPAGYQDRTVNVFTAPGQPALNLSRDKLGEGESLTDYIARQLKLMSQHLKGWKEVSRGPAVLGDNLCQGEYVEAGYIRDGKRVAQRQAVFAIDDGRVLVFTVSIDGPLSDADRQQLADLLRTFRFHS